MSIIQVEHLTRQFGGMTAVRDLSFTVEKGEIVGFLGPNGAGKTTTMRMLTGALGATGGRVLIDGVDVFREPRKAKRLIGYLPEVPPLYTDMTVRSFLRFCARIRGVSDVRAATEQVIGQVGLQPVAHRLIDHLSKGYRQRVGIAQALVHSPALLILDEPTSGLDPGQRKEIRELITELSAGDTTVVLSTHILPEVEAIANRVLVMNKGSLVSADALAQMEDSIGIIRMLVARPSPDLLASLAAVESVQSVEEPKSGVIAIRASSDVREQVARIAVESGLLHLAMERNLENFFIKLTEEVS